MALHLHMKLEALPLAENLKVELKRSCFENALNDCRNDMKRNWHNIKQLWPYTYSFIGQMLSSCQYTKVRTNSTSCLYLVSKGKECAPLLDIQHQNTCSIPYCSSGQTSILNGMHPIMSSLMKHHYQHQLYGHQHYLYLIVACCYVYTTQVESDAHRV